MNNEHGTLWFKLEKENVKNGYMHVPYHLFTLKSNRKNDNNTIYFVAKLNLTFVLIF